MQNGLPKDSIFFNVSSVNTKKPDEAGHLEKYYSCKVLPTTSSSKACGFETLIFQLKYLNRPDFLHFKIFPGISFYEMGMQ